MTHAPEVPTLLERTGLSYRQLDHWTTLGLIHADRSNPGSGLRRTWSDDELQVAGIIGQLRLQGMGLHPAAAAARHALADTTPTRDAFTGRTTPTARVVVEVVWA